MPWEEIAAALAEHLRNLITNNEQAIRENARANPDTPLQISEAEFSEALEVATNAVRDIDRAVIDDFISQTSAAIDDFDFSDNADELMRFYTQKNIVEGVQRIHSAEIFRQVFEEDRPAAVDRAVEQTLSLIDNFAASEASSSFALKHQALAIENDFRYYTYHTSEDEVVRGLHSARNGRAFAYGQERVVDDVPGLASRCRCFASPITFEEALEATFFYPEDKPSVSADMKPKFNIRAMDGTAVIDVVGAIDEWDGNDYIQFAAKVKAYLEDETTELVVNVTSYGGNGIDGAQAYNLLKGIPNRVTTNVYGYAGSAATYFVMAADHATIGELDEFFIHEAWTCIPCGNKAELLREAEDAANNLGEFDQLQIEMYVAKSGRSREEINQLLIEAQAMSAQRAFDLGFFDEIRPDDNRSKAARGEPIAQANFNALNAQRVTTEEEMTLAQLLAALSADAELQASLLKELGLDNVDELKAQIETLTTQNTQLATQVAEQASVISAHQSAGDSVSEEQRNEIYAQARADLAAETEELTTITDEVTDAGLEVDGDNAADIRANAIEQAGGITEGLPPESLASVWASIYAMRKGNKPSEDNDDAQINALGDKGDTPAKRTSRAAGINKARA